MNADGVVVPLGCSGDTLTLYAVFKLVRPMNAICHSVNVDGMVGTSQHYML